MCPCQSNIDVTELYYAAVAIFRYLHVEYFHFQTVMQGSGCRSGALAETESEIIVASCMGHGGGIFSTERSAHPHFVVHKLCSCYPHLLCNVLEHPFCLTDQWYLLHHRRRKREEIQERVMESKTKF
jgi:hypothetical protein